MHKRCRSPAPLLALVALVALAAGCAAAPTAGVPERLHPYPQVGADRARVLLASRGSRLVVLDVRTPEEFLAGHLAGAINLDVTRPDFRDCLADLDWRLSYLVMCKAGRRSAHAAAIMEEMQFEHVFEMACGYDGWLAAGYPVATGEPGSDRGGFNP